MRWYIERISKSPPKSAFKRAASKGRIDVLDLPASARQPRPIPSCACSGAVASGSADVLRWSLARGCRPTAEATVDAARYNDVELLRTLAEEGGAPVDADAFANAANQASNECMLYLCGIGCPVRSHDLGMLCEACRGEPRRRGRLDGLAARRSFVGIVFPAPSHL